MGIFETSLQCRHHKAKIFPVARDMDERSVKADLHGTTLPHTTSLQQASTCLRTINTRTTLSLTKLNMQKFAPGFTERKF